MSFEEKANCVVVLLGIIGIASLPLLVGNGCSEKEQKPAAIHKYHVGQIVNVKLTGDPVMITYCFYYYGNTQHPWYECRVGTVRQKHRDGLVSADTMIAAYTKVNFAEYELEPRSQ